MATEEQLKQALIAADRKGDKKAANLFATKIKEMRLAKQTPAESIPIFDNAGNPIEPDAPRPRQELSAGDYAKGLGETALALGTGVASSLLNTPVGFVRGLADSVQSGQFGTQAGSEKIAQAIQNQIGYGVNQPESEAGRRMVGAIGETLGALPPVVGGFSPAQLAAAGQSAKASARVAPTAAAESAQAARQAAQTAKQSFASRSVGAAEIPIEQIRRQQAQDLPVPLNITKGMATQDRTQQSFEIETAKNEELGADLRQRNLELNQGINQNLDEFITQTGTKLPETAWRSETGNVVVTVLQKGYEREKQKVKNAYDAARARGETQEIISVDPLADYLNSQSVDVTVAPVVGLIAREAKRLGVGDGSIEDGTFRLSPMSIEQSETLRQRVNNLVDNANGQDLARAGQIKRLIDQAQDQAGGKVFQSARKQRMQLANKYENLAIIDQLLDTKGKYKDQRIAAENVINKAVINGSVRDLKNLRRVLSTAGDDGIEALKEVRAAAVRHIRDESTRNVGRDPSGTPIISAKGMDNAIKALDRDGKLDILFGKKEADKLRLLNDVTKDIMVAQPNAGNASGTASTVLAAMDMYLSAAATIPMPILSSLRIAAKRAKERKIKKRVQESLK